MGTRPPTNALSLQGGLLSLSNSLALPSPSEVSTKHPLLDRLGLDVHLYKNIIHLPTSSSIDPTRTVHIGRHTSNYDKMILSRLDEIEALDADDIIKRMHVNDLMENTGDDLRNNRLRLNNH